MFLHELPRLFPAGIVRPPDRMFLVLIFGTVGGVVLFFYGFSLIRRKRLLETTPTSTIRSLALGIVEIIGTAEINGSALSAPFSDLPCVFFSYKVEEEHGSGKNRHWETLVQGSSEQPFLVRDGSGTISVFPQGANAILQYTRTYRNDRLGSLPPRVIAGLAGLGISSSGWLGTKTVRCHESCLLPGATVFVFGTAQENAGAGGGGDQASRVFIGLGNDSQFLISDRTEQDLIGRWRWQATALLCGGPALTLGCLFAILKWYVQVVH
jgi:E3 ubiquitin ligase